MAEGSGPGERSVGEVLRAAREAKRLSVPDVNRATRIRPAFLEAIEEDRFTDLPPAPYVEIFIAAYAKAVGFPPREILERYYGMTGETPSSLVPIWDETSEQQARPRGRRFPWVALLAVVILLVAVALLARRA